MCVFFFFLLSLTSGFHPHDLLTNWPGPGLRKKKKKTRKVITFYHANPPFFHIDLLLCSGTRGGKESFFCVYTWGQKWPLILSLPLLKKREVYPGMCEWTPSTIHRIKGNSMPLEGGTRWRVQGSSNNRKNGGEKMFLGGKKKILPLTN